MSLFALQSFLLQSLFVLPAQSYNKVLFQRPLNYFSAIFILRKVIHWARMNPLAGQFWLVDHMFDTPALRGDFESTDLSPEQQRVDSTYGVQALIVAEMMIYSVMIFSLDTGLRYR